MSENDTNLELVDEKSMKDNEKKPGFFKRNKKFLLFALPFFAVMILLVAFNISAYDSDYWRWTTYDFISTCQNIILPILRSLFAVIYFVLMYVFWRKNNARFSNYDISDKKIIKKDKIINSIILLMPLLIIFGFSIFYFVSDARNYNFYWYNFPYNIIATIDIVILSNSFLLTLFMICMYAKNKLKSFDRKDSKIIKNKRLISWAYIWRFLLLFSTSALTCKTIEQLLGSQLVSYFETKYNTLIENALISAFKVETIQVYHATVLGICAAFAFICLLLIGNRIINKVLKKKVSIEEQNKKFIKKSVGLFVILLTVLFISFDTISAWDIISKSYNEIENSYYEQYELAMDFKDLMAIGIAGPVGFEQVKMLDSIYIGFNPQELFDAFSYFKIWFLVYTILKILLCFEIIRITFGTINRLTIENTKDDNGNVIPTQEKLKKEYKTLLVFVVSLNLLLFICLFTLYKILTYKEPLYGKHELLKDADFYSVSNKNGDIIETEDNEVDTENEEDAEDEEVDFEDEEVDFEDEEDTEDEEEKRDIDKEYEDFMKLDHDDNWYLENDISYMDSRRYIYAHPDYKPDEELDSSARDKANKFGKRILQYDTLFDAEEDLGIVFKHTDNKLWLYVLDNKSMLNGVGIGVKVNDFTHREIIKYFIYYGGFYYDPKTYEEKPTPTIDDIDVLVPLIYADMSFEDVVKILGESYYSISYINDDADEFNYIWEDKLGNKLSITFEEGVIHNATLTMNKVE